MPHGIIFDMDNTLMDSALDFDAIRKAMDFPAGQPLLEHIEALPAEQAAQHHAALRQHELTGARQATPLPGVVDFLEHIERKGWKKAVLTRNSREAAGITLERLQGGDTFDVVISREDGPPKPDPWAILHICQQWQTTPAEVVMIGDYHFDINAGNRAGAHTVLIAHTDQHLDEPWVASASYVTQSFSDASFLAWLEAVGNID